MTAKEYYDRFLLCFESNAIIRNFRGKYKRDFDYTNNAGMDGMEISSIISLLDKSSIVSKNE
ncbi:MAG TPA: hypothetical protein VK469_18100 [Candidatus Kapabacteria bacterium]|nr:hypothetical protein [Candidatus Kapabacteria bacterium]